jgi:hypothetical protein
MRDRVPGRHDVDFARPKIALTTQAVVMDKLTVQEPRDGLQAHVRMWRHIHRRAFAECQRSEAIEKAPRTAPAAVHDSAATSAMALLFVAFDDPRRSDLCVVRILAELSARAPLSKQVPALVQPDLNLLEPGLILIGQGRVTVESLLFMSQFGNPLQHGLIGRVLLIHIVIVP